LTICCLASGCICWALALGLRLTLSIVRDPETYEKFEEVVVVHGVREVAELAYRDLFTRELPEHEFLGEMVRDKVALLPNGHTRSHSNTKVASQT
jgi:ferredoxin/flavodoxin---NADP+ reductase